jgi:hypothetical protein
MRMAHRGVLFSTAVLGSMVAGAAPAAPPAAPPSPRPAWVWPLELRAEDEALVEGLSDGSSEKDKVRARAMVRSLAAAAPWKARVIAERKGRLLSGPPQDGDRAPAQAALERITKKLSLPAACPAARRRLVDFVNGLEKGGSPLPIESEVLATCGAPTAPLGPEVRILTIPSRRDETVSVLIMGATFRWITGLASVTIRNRVLSFVAVSTRDLVLISKGESAEPGAFHLPRVPAAERVLVDGDSAAPLREPACLDLSRLKISDGSTVFIDGFEVTNAPSAELSLPTAAANLQVFDRSANLVLGRKIPASELGGLNCTTIDEDATSPAKKTVLVFVTNGGRSCAEVGVDPLKVRTQVEEILRPRYETRGIEVVEMLEAVADVRGALKVIGDGSQGGAGQSGDLSGSADVARALQDVGFSLALTLDVQCTRTAGGDVQYTVAGRRVDLDGLVEAANHNERSLRMDAIGQVLSSQIETQTGEQNLRGLLEATVGRLFHMPYVRFANGGSDNARRGDIHFRIEAASGASRVKTQLFARPVREDDGGLCTNLADLNAVRSTKPVPVPSVQGSGGWVETRDSNPDRETPSPTELALSGVDIPFYPVEPGQYFLEVTVSDGNPPGKDTVPAVTTHRCVTVAEASYALAFELDHVGGLARGRIWQGETTSTTYAFGGVTRHMTEAYGFGLLAGLGYSIYEANGPPSWSDIPRSASSSVPATSSAASSGFASDGTMTLGWTRISIAVALSFELRLGRLADLVPGCWRHGIQSSMFRASGVYVGVTPLLDLGWYFPGSIPGGLKDFRGSAGHPFDLDGSALVSLFYKLNLPDGQVLKIGLQAGWLGFDDWGRSDARKQAHITYDNWLSWGPQIGFGWSP